METHQAIQMVYLVLFLFSLWFIHISQIEEKDIYDAKDIVLTKSKKGFFIKRRDILYRKKIFGPFPTKRNLFLQLETLKGALTEEALKKIKNYFPKKVSRGTKTEAD